MVITRSTQWNNVPTDIQGNPSFLIESYDLFTHTEKGWQHWWWWQGVNNKEKDSKEKGLEVINVVNDNDNETMRMMVVVVVVAMTMTMAMEWDDYDDNDNESNDSDGYSGDDASGDIARMACDGELWWSLSIEGFQCFEVTVPWSFSSICPGYTSIDLGACTKELKWYLRG